MRAIKFLFALLNLSSSETENPCRARAWVRAPDLEPGHVIQGDVKIKLDGACADVSKYSLRLRFAERSWVKTRRADIRLPEPPVSNPVFYRFGDAATVFDSSAPWRDSLNVHGMDPSALAKYHNDLKDPALWLVRQEERIGFEAKYNLSEDNPSRHDVEETFAILIPSTNYPPAFDWRSGSRIGSADTMNGGAEHIYAYLVDVTFANGTTVEVMAGYTSFKPQLQPIASALEAPETLNITAVRVLRSNDNADMIRPAEDQFTLEITFPHGRHLEQGSVNNITIVSHQLGPGYQQPEGIDWSTVYISQKRHWAASQAADNQTAEKLLDVGWMRNSHLKPTNPLVKSHLRQPRFDQYEGLKFPQEGLVENGTVFTSKPVTLEVEVPEDCYPPFDMHYQISEAELSISLRVQNISSVEEDDEDDPDYDWIPTIKISKPKPSELLKASIPLYIYLKSDLPAKAVTSDFTHYLASGARAPIFVDPSSITDLLHKSVEDRDALSPKARAKIVTSADGKVVQEQYYGSSGQQRPGLRYVGDTWLRKVMIPKRDGITREAASKSGGLVVQS